jgi:hypothetical protein
VGEHFPVLQTTAVLSFSWSSNCFLVKLQALSESTHFTIQCHIVVGFRIQHCCCGNIKLCRVEVIFMLVKVRESTAIVTE